MVNRTSSSPSGSRIDERMPPETPVYLGTRTDKKRATSVVRSREAGPPSCDELAVQEESRTPVSWRRRQRVSFRRTNKRGGIQPARRPAKPAPSDIHTPLTAPELERTKKDGGSPSGGQTLG